MQQSSDAIDTQYARLWGACHDCGFSLRDDSIRRWIKAEAVRFGYCKEVRLLKDLPPELLKLLADKAEGRLIRLDVPGAA